MDLLEHLLVLDPEQRFTCEQVLAHPYLKVLHELNIDDEPVTTEVLSTDFEIAETSADIRSKSLLIIELIAKECLEFKPKPLAKPQQAVSKK